ncbi:MAG: PorT family protein [Bacteroidales bacterium]|nr:PorT family protein [Bacteroidales bacterium]
MKKATLIILVLTFLCVLSASSQQKPFVFGFKAGPNIGWMKPDAQGYESDGIKGGFSWGFIADFFLMENYGIATGFDVIFLNSGLKMPHMEADGGETLTGTLHRKYKLKYIQIPITLKMQTKEMGKFRIYGQIGLGTGFLIGAKADDEFIQDTGETTNTENDIYDDISFIRSSLILGAGVEYSLGGSTNLLAGFSFDNGFIDILKGQNTLDPTINNKGYVNYVSFIVGIVF